MKITLTSSALAKAVFKFKHGMPLSFEDKNLIKHSEAATLAVTMYQSFQQSDDSADNAEIDALSDKNTGTTVNTKNGPTSKSLTQFLLSTQAASNSIESDKRDVIDEIFVTDSNTLKRLFSFQIKHDEDEQMWYVAWYLANSAGFVGESIASCTERGGVPQLTLFIQHRDERQAAKLHISSLTLTGDLTPESEYLADIDPTEILNNYDMILELHCV